ncbi:UNVERIFIED_CONTAM: Pentatricopeptide repeat-containing protein [Sesamum calycinum]|uniref:Pentatricopeptide repeat-containing protein n=1 Tax=Sesamum calycinum TaxID=2727403 RepID=A0AAW2R8F7_9LAMI
MRALFIGRGLKIQIELKPFCLSNSCKRFSYSNDGPSDMDVHKENEVVRRTVENVCHVLESGPWGPSLEKALSSVDDKPQADVVIGVLRRMKNVDLGVRKLIDLNMFSKMSLAGFSPSVETSVELVSSCVKAQRLRDAFDLIQTMRKFKFRPGFSAYTTLIGALAMVHKPDYPDLMLSLFYQMQELGYEVNVHLFTTLIRVLARDGRVDAALSLLDEMKSNSFDADIVLYNVCIDCFGKVGKVDIAWKFFHEIKSHGLMPDDVSYTSMIGVLCKASRLAEAVELFEQMEQNRTVPCAYAYNTMIMGYGSAGRFDEAYSLLERQRLKGPYQV